MASDYGLNFGFRRSDESVLTREGRFRTPAAGTLWQGMAVVIDPSNAGDLAVGSANEPLVTGFSGLLIQEAVHIRSVYEQPEVDSFDLGAVRNAQQAQFVFGAGAKVWFQNTPAQTREDGRSISAVTVVNVTGLTAVGDTLGWGGTNWVQSDGGTTTPDWFKITALDLGTAGSEYIEAVLLG